jgi:hypothetical protein
MNAEYPAKPREHTKIVRWLICQNITNLMYENTGDVGAAVQDAVKRETASLLFVDQGIMPFTQPNSPKGQIGGGPMDHRDSWKN